MAKPLRDSQGRFRSRPKALRDTRGRFRPKPIRDTRGRFKRKSLARQKPSARKQSRPRQKIPTVQPQRRRAPAPRRRSPGARPDIRKIVKSIKIDTAVAKRARKEDRRKPVGKRLKRATRGQLGRVKPRVRLRQKKGSKKKRRIRALSVSIQFRGKESSPPIKGKVGKFTKNILFTDRTEKGARWHPISSDGVEKRKAELVAALEKQYGKKMQLLNIEITEILDTEKLERGKL